MKKIKCSVCRFRFKAEKKNKYLASEKNITSFVNPKTFEAFDCPECGCQNIVNSRVTEDQ